MTKPHNEITKNVTKIKIQTEKPNLKYFKKI